MAFSLSVVGFRSCWLAWRPRGPRCVPRALPSCPATTRQPDRGLGCRPSHPCVLRFRRRFSLPPGPKPSAFHRVLLEPPLHRRFVRSPLQQAEACVGTALPHAAHVPSSWFLTTLTASSSSRATGLLHPAAGHGVHRVRPTALRRATCPSPMPCPSERSPPMPAVLTSP
jgi:hypothetical protein